MTKALDSLKHIPNWVCWRNVPSRKANGDMKNIKMPVSPITGIGAKTNDSSTWGTYEQAKSLYLSSRNMSGLGFVFSTDIGIVGIDLDHCIKENGEYTDFAKWVLSKIDSYTEISPSGDGLHILVRGVIPSSVKKEYCEIYEQERYFTMTGNMVEGRSDAINLAQHGLMEVYDKIAKKEAVVRQSRVDLNTRPELSEIRELLRFIPKQTSYNDVWIRCLMAIHSEYPGQDGIAVVDEWCGDICASGEIEHKFKSFTRSGKSSTRIGTLYHIAGQYGWQRQTDPLDTIVPQLTPSQKMQVEVVVEQLAEEKAWVKYHQYLMDNQSYLNGMPMELAKHFSLGRKPSIIEEATGEVLNGGGYTVPYTSQDGDVYNLEYRYDSGKIEYDSDKYYPYYCKPFDNEPTIKRTALMFNTSMSALKAYASFWKDFRIGEREVEWLGLPNMPLADDSAKVWEHLDEIFVIFDKNTDIARMGLSQFNGRIRGVMLPMPVEQAIDYMSADDVFRFIRTSEKLEKLC